MVDVEALTVSIEAAGLAIACLGLLLGLSHRHVARPYGLLACMFGTLVVADLHEMAHLVMTDLAPVLDDGLRMASYTSAFLIAPAFLFYVRALVGVMALPGSRTLPIHLAPSGIAALTTMAFLALPSEARGAAFGLGSLAHPPSVAPLVGQAMSVLAVALYAQCLVYALLILRVQTQHRERLKDLFASTERYEMRWIVGMTLLLCSFQIVNLLALAGQTLRLTGPLPQLVSALFEIAIVSVLVLWGFRQSPGLFVAVEASTRAQAAKYAKSALDTDRAARIARKLRAGMERDALYRDPNLSLWTLSQHVGVSPNYVSQSLNEHMGQSFFDYVNGWRIEAAKPMIQDGSRTIEEIAYDVGFNSRSSFYTAFKKNTGLTPKSFCARERLESPNEGLTAECA